MATTYTNNVEAIKNGLDTLVRGEFLPNKVQFVFAEMYQGEYLKNGEYIRYWIEETEFAGAMSDGEIRKYEFDMPIYFDLKNRNLNKDFKNWASEESERLMRLLNDNRAYSPSGTYIWHHLFIESPGFLRDLIIVEEFEEEEEEGLEHIKIIPHKVIITRGNFN